MPPSQVQVRRVDAAEADLVAPLFALYRQFYGQPYDEEKAAGFLRDRVSLGQSVVLVAEVAREPVGFTQLYPTFSSVSAAVKWVLNDLYVVASARGNGVAAALMAHAELLARAAGACSLTLETGSDNVTAQRLYKRQGYRVEHGVKHYEKPLTAVQ